MRVTKISSEKRCAVCERTLLMGERTVRFSSHGAGTYVDVCQLCQEAATDSGWVKEGSPTTPTIPTDRRRTSRFSLSALLGSRVTEAPIASEPILRRLSEGELAIVEAADHFNASQFRRTVGGVAKSLGVPKVSIAPISGVNQEIVITVAWDISWYQYRVTPDMAQPVRLADRGHEPNELDPSFTDWNAHMSDDGRIVPDIARI